MGGGAGGIAKSGTSNGGKTPQNEGNAFKKVVLVCVQMLAHVYDYAPEIWYSAIFYVFMNDSERGTKGTSIVILTRCIYDQLF